MKSLLLVAVLLMAPTAAIAQEQRTVTVMVSVSKDSARDILLDKLMAAGLTPGAADASTVTTVPERLSGAMGMSGLVTYRALLIPSSGGTRIALTGWLRNTGGEALAKAMTATAPTPDEKQLSSSWRGAGKRAWDRLVAIGDSIQAAAPRPSTANDSSSIRDLTRS